MEITTKKGLIYSAVTEVKFFGIVITFLHDGVMQELRCSEVKSIKSTELCHSEEKAEVLKGKATTKVEADVKQ